MSRRAMFAPIRPSPIIPSCMIVSWVILRTHRARIESSWDSPLLVEVDQSTGRGVVAGDRRVAVELGQDLRSELLAELDAPLIEAVDVPDDALDEDLVLVQRDQRAERARRDL